jgi:hypothetical protein
VVAIAAAWSGSPFRCARSFAPHYSNDQGAFSFSGDRLIINPSGSALSSDANTTENVTIVAT